MYLIDVKKQPIRNYPGNWSFEVETNQSVKFLINHCFLANEGQGYIKREKEVQGHHEKVFQGQELN